MILDNRLFLFVLLCIVFFLPFKLYGQFQSDIDIWVDRYNIEQTKPIIFEVQDYKIEINSTAYGRISATKKVGWDISVLFKIYKEGVFGRFSYVMDTRDYLDSYYKVFLIQNSNLRDDISNLVEEYYLNQIKFDIPFDENMSSKEWIKYFSKVEKLEFRIYERNRIDYLEFEFPDHQLFFENLYKELDKVETEYFDD